MENSSETKNKVYNISGILYHNNSNKPINEQWFNGFITIKGEKFDIKAKYEDLASNGSPYFKITPKNSSEKSIRGAIFIEEASENRPAIKADVHLAGENWKVSGFHCASKKPGGAPFLSLTERLVPAAAPEPAAAEPHQPVTLADGEGINPFEVD